LKNAAEGSYDAVIVDSSDPIGNYYNQMSSGTTLFLTVMLNNTKKQPLLIVCQVLQRSCLRNPSSNLWLELFVLVELCALKLKACGFTWTSSKTLFPTAVRSSRVL